MRAETFERLQAEVDCLDAKSFMYPWPELEETVAKNPGHTLLLVGYDFFGVGDAAGVVDDDGDAVSSQTFCDGCTDAA